MARRPAALITAVGFAGLLLLGSPASGQDRFQVLTQQAMADVSGLRVVIVRDNQLSACFTLFIMEPPAAPSAVPEALAPAVNDATQQSVQRIRNASQARDRQLAELNAQFEQQVRRNALGTPDALQAGRYEADRKKIDDEFEHVLRTEIPGSYPSATLTPGMRTGGWEDQANAIRRAMLDPDPTSTMTAASQFGRLDELLTRLLEAPRLAASGPAACAASVETKKPIR